MEKEEEILEMIRSNPNLVENVEFMQKAITVNTKFISLDKTNDESLYKLYANLKEKELRSNPTIYNTHSTKKILAELSRVLQEIDSPKKVEAGKYKIPNKYLFELIRDCEHSPEDVPYDFSMYFDADGMYDKEFGEGLQELYDDPDYILGMHGTSRVISEQDIQKVLAEGLKATTQGMGPGHLGSHVYYGDNLRFLNALVFNRNSPNLPETMFILKIPKKVFDKGSPIPLYGSDKERIDSDAHILPEYMWGYTYRKAGKEYNSIDEQMYDRKLAQVPVKPINYKYGYYEMTTGLKNPILLPKISTITPEKAVKNALSGITLAETNAARNEQSHIEIEGDITYGE